MKPIRIFIFFTAVLVLVFILALVIPERGIGITGDLQLSFMSLSELFREDTLNREENVERLLAGSMVADDPETDPPVDLFVPADSGSSSSEPLISPVNVDSLQPSLIKSQFSPANVDSLQQSLFRIQFARGGSELLHPFFRKLDEVKSGNDLRTRILHFGDSQIENDRMTALIRYRLQRHFGGTGTGLVQAIPLYSGSMAYKQFQRGEWLRYTYFGKRDTSIRHNSFGVMGAFASVPATSGEEWPMLHYRFNRSRRTGKCDRIRIFLHSYVDSATIVFHVNDTIADTLINISDGFSVADYRHHCQVNEVKIFLDFPEGGRIYGISFESYRGVQMDNIAMRGSSGLVFTKMDWDQQQSMMDHLSPGLILLQYGGNVVPYMNPRYYRQAFIEELQYYKEICPGVPVIVIGPADMSVREKGRFITYPGLESIRDALRFASLESGFAFWDLYEAMGGLNSMPSFVHSDPPLARTDYVHFTQLGINLMAEIFYNALMLEYNNYLSKNSRTH